MTRLRAGTGLAAALVTVAIPSVAFAGAASAAPVRWEPSTVSWGPDLYEDFCDVAGLTVENQGYADDLSRTKPRGPDGLPYFSYFTTSVDTYTNVETEEYVTVVSSYLAADQKVTDNGDGTLSVIVRNAGGPTVIYNQDGELVGRGDAGLFSYEYLIDHAGTPTDPSDDEFLGFQRVVKDVGGDLDLCATVVQAIG